MPKHASERAPGKFVLGVDIGGTKVAAGLVNSRGKVLRAARSHMIARGSAEQGFRAVQDAIDAVAAFSASVKISKYQYVGFDFPILDEMW